MSQASIGGLLSVKMVQLSGEAELKRSAKDKQVDNAEMHAPCQRYMVFGSVKRLRIP
jgi:hypothetical protein